MQEALRAASEAEAMRRSEAAAAREAEAHARAAEAAERERARQVEADEESQWLARQAADDARREAEREAAEARRRAEREDAQAVARRVQEEAAAAAIAEVRSSRRGGLVVFFWEVRVSVCVCGFWVGVRVSTVSEICWQSGWMAGALECNARESIQRNA